MVARIGMTLPHQARRKQLSHPYDHNGTHKREYFDGFTGAKDGDYSIVHVFGTPSEDSWRFASHGRLGRHILQLSHCVRPHHLPDRISLRMNIAQSLSYLL